MAATGEPYSVAARALDAAEPGAQEPDAAEPRATGAVDDQRVAAEPVAAESVAAAPVAVESLAADQAPDPAGALAELVACAARTLTAPSARVEIRSDTDLDRDPESDRRRPGLIGGLARRAATGILGRVAPDVSAAELRTMFLHQFGAGVIEPAAGRYLIDFGGWAQMLTDGRRFSGRSGQPLGPRYENRPGRSRRDDPFDVLRRVQAATAARWAGEETVRQTRCRVVAATAGQDQFTVWIDDERIRRFQTVERGSGRTARATTTETVELWDFGVPVDELDWSRLPAFRTPD
jgi:hypothetical protein